LAGLASAIGAIGKRLFDRQSGVALGLPDQFQRTGSIARVAWEHVDREDDLAVDVAGDGSLVPGKSVALALAAMPLFGIGCRGNTIFGRPLLNARFRIIRPGACRLDVLEQDRLQELRRFLSRFPGACGQREEAAGIGDDLAQKPVPCVGVRPIDLGGAFDARFRVAAKAVCPQPVVRPIRIYRLALRFFGERPAVLRGRMDAARRL
jgi:hypothetical protein